MHWYICETRMILYYENLCDENEQIHISLYVYMIIICINYLYCKISISNTELFSLQKLTGINCRGVNYLRFLST